MNYLTHLELNRIKINTADKDLLILLFTLQHDQDLKHTVAAMAGDGLPPGEIQILHATPEQISQLQQAHHIQILQGDQVIQMPVGVPVSSLFLFFSYIYNS